MRRQLSWVLAIVLFLGVLNAGLPGSGGGGHTAYADAQVTAATYKIPVTPTMVKNESAYGDPSKLFDQQTVAGDPKGGTGGAADSSFWFGYWGAATESVFTNYPAYAYIDLGQTYKLTDVYLRDRDTKGDFTVYTGTPAGSGNWTEQFTDDLCDVSCSTYSSYAWKGHTIDNVETRYVRFKMASRDSAVSEIVLYGIPVPAKIPLSPAMVTNESGYGDATRLVDEQAAAGDPLNGAGGAPNKFWFGAWEESYNPASTSYPAYAYIDLGRSYNLSHIFLYDYNDPGAWDNASASFNVYTGSPGSWTLAFDATHSGSSSGWLSRSVNGVVTRYVRVESSRLAAVMSEIVLYGSPAEAVLPPQIPLNISMVTYDVAGAMNAYTLVDDQSAVGDPLRGSTVSDWSKLHAWTDWSGNAYINLGQNYMIDNLFLGDYTGTGTVNIYTGSGDPVVWTQVDSDMLNSYGAWNRHRIGVTAQHLRIQKLGGGQISEIVLYGTPVPKPILLADTMVHNISGFTNPTLMVNQQAQAGDPLNGSLPGAADAVAAANVTATSYPADAYIDLGSPYLLTNIALLDGDDLAASGQGVQVYAGAPGSWNAQPLFTDRMLNRAQWNMHPVSVTTQYVRVVKTSGNANFSEIVLYGTRVGGALKDETPPSAVTDLTTTAVGSIAATLQWTAPGDSGTAGTAASYEVRYSTSNITADNFSAATLVANAPAPLGAGTKQTMTISGLTPETTYYFALKTKDGAGNISALSNVLSRTMNAVDNTAPGAVTNLAAAYVSGNAVRLTWTSPGDDGATGTATSYALRYSTSDITTGNWTSATAAGFVPIPAAAGKQQSAWVYGLNPSTSYKFAIRATDEAGNVADLSNTADATTTALVASTKLDLSNVPIINEVAHGDASKLFDQQTASGDPRASMGGALSTDDPSTRWELGSSDIYLPASAVIDLGVETEISDIYVYDGNGSSVTNGPLTLSAGDPFNWQPLTTDSLTGYQQWNSHPVKATTRYLQVKRTTKGADAVEIVIYGTRLGTPEAQPQPAAQPPLPTMDQLIGINAFIDDRKDRMQVAGFVREYHNWDWDEGDLAHWGTIHTDYPGYPNNLNKFNPTYASSGGWNFDAYYDDLKNLGITVSPAIKESVSWMTISKHNKPIDSGQSALDPASYAAHSDHMFQYAARYGSTAVADSKLKLAADQPRSSGLGTLQYFEDWNEQDKWWEGRNSFFTPYEYAAMASADYDGDQRRMGDTFGVKNADPNAKLVMSGLADPNLDYIKALKFWSDWNRGGSVPFDVINIHHYSNNGTDQTTGTVGISPEADNLKTLLKKFVDYRNQYMPGKEVWITEFGYDINAVSVQRAPAIGNKSAQEVQGEWLVRSYLAASAAGIDKASMYMLRDVNPNSTTKFDSAGLTSTLGTQEVPKISWYYVYTLKNQLTGMRYDSEVASDNGNVRIYKYVNDANNKDVYVLWAPTSNDTVVTDYALALENAGTSVSLVTMEEGDTDGVTSALTVAGGAVSVDVSERPVFVVVDKSSANNGGSNNGGSNNGGSDNGGSDNGGSDN
ncbi:MAG: fibronectin type III domain-containing protein, partial [Paenibacillaceae bacterium]|nr:fibronectin type III domain-containing protein [Paenibacillaceae bacterium]